MSFKQTAANYDRQCGRVLRAWRRARGLSQDSLGKLSERTFQQVQKYELARNRMSVGCYLAYAELLQVYPVLPFEQSGPDPETLRLLARIEELQRKYSADQIDALLDSLIQL